MNQLKNAMAFHTLAAHFLRAFPCRVKLSAGLFMLQFFCLFAHFSPLTNLFGESLRGGGRERVWHSLSQRGDLQAAQRMN
jgi:hypothetical protein